MVEAVGDMSPWQLAIVYILCPILVAYIIYLIKRDDGRILPQISVKYERKIATYQEMVSEVNRLIPGSFTEVPKHSNNISVYRHAFTISNDSHKPLEHSDFIHDFVVRSNVGVYSEFRYDPESEIWFPGANHDFNCIPRDIMNYGKFELGAKRHCLIIIHSKTQDKPNISYHFKTFKVKRVNY